MPATLPYSPLTPQTHAECLRTYPCRYARYAKIHPVQPLKGLQEPRTASVSYRNSIPAGHAGFGDALSYRPSSPNGERKNGSVKALPNWDSVSTTPPPFRHTPCRFWPQETPPVWRNLIQHPRGDESYTFSAKERDSETGLSYFGSRYYSSDLSIWLSVDPMSDKYASLSPYVYCADNPVKLVDPDGEAWEVNQDGYIRQTGDENDHTLYVVNGKEQNFGDRLTYRHGKLKGQAISTPVDEEVMKSFTTNENGYSQMNLTGKEEAGLKMMRFFSLHTNVEWSFWGGNAWDDESNTESAYATIGTSHSYKEDKGSTPLVLNSSIKRNERHTTPLKFFIHTHPYQEVHGSWASGKDKLIRDFCKGENPSAQFGIIHRGKLYDYGNNRIWITF